MKPALEVDVTIGGLRRLERAALEEMIRHRDECGCRGVACEGYRVLATLWGETMAALRGQLRARRRQLAEAAAQ